MLFLVATGYLYTRALPWTVLVPPSDMLEDLHSVFTRLRIASLQSQYVSPFPFRLSHLQPPGTAGLVTSNEKYSAARAGKSLTRAPGNSVISTSGKRTRARNLVRTQTSTLSPVTTQGSRRLLLNRRTVVRALS